jgi:hypothetical protein
MLMTPLTAFGPNKVPPGPLITSICWMSSSNGAWRFQNTVEASGV